MCITQSACHLSGSTVLFRIRTRTRMTSPDTHKFVATNPSQTRGSPGTCKRCLLEGVGQGGVIHGGPPRDGVNSMLGVPCERF